MTNILLILVSGIFVQNFILSKFLGICPFLGVSKQIETAVGMGIAVTFVQRSPMWYSMLFWIRWVLDTYRPLPLFWLLRLWCSWLK